MKKTAVLLLGFIASACISNAQSLTNVNPDSANSGQSLTVSITGVATNFAQGSQVFNVWFSQGSTTIYANWPPSIISNTLLDADFNIPTNTSTGWYDVNVNNDWDGIVTMTNGFYIQGPEITTVNPNVSGRNLTLTVSITGQNTNFTQGSGVFSVWFDPGSPTINGFNLTTINDTLLNADFSIPPLASLGFWDVNVSDDYDGIVTKINGFEIQCVTLTTSVIDASCFNDCDGSASVSVTGGTVPPVTYSWNTTPVQTTAAISSQCAGTYIVTVTDGTGCNSTASATINEPPDLIATTTGTDELCNGSCDGTFTIFATGGTSPYLYNGVPDSNVVNLCAGPFSYTVTDANSCSFDVTHTVDQPNVLSITITTTDATCNNACDGTATATVTGGVSPYTYSDQTGLCAGIYSMTVTDSNGCTATSPNYTIDEPSAIAITSEASTDITCTGANDGTITITASGGTGTLEYSIDGGIAFPNTTGSFTGLIAGTYNIVVKDANGCTQAGSAITIINPPAISITSEASTDITCNGFNDGTISITASGGTGTLEYSIDGGTTFQGSGSFTGLIAGTYNIVVKDANGCTQTGSTITIIDPSALSLVTGSVDATCGGSDGEATVTASGGTGAYTYSWNTTPVQTASTATGLPSGIYTCIVTDSSNCADTATVGVSDAGGPVASTTSVDATCGGSNGSASVSVSGGTPPYTYAWDTSPVQTDSTATGLPAGLYSITVTDSLGCSAADAVTVSDVGNPTAVISSSTNVSCNGGNDGAATVAATGGTAPYSYSWSPSGGIDTTETGLSAATYTVTVTDSNGCTAIANIIITEPFALVTSVTSADASCYGVNDATATVNASGGTGAYTYLWGDGQTTSTATGLAANTYSVLVTDSNGCSITDSATINQPPTALTTGITGFDESNCQANGIALLTVSGGATPYTFSWSNGATTQNLNGLTVGTYVVTVTDSNSCIAVDSVNIGGGVPPTTSISGFDESGCGTNDGIALLTVTGGTLPYTYSWSNGATTQNISGLTAGTYTVTVTDSTGCAANDNIIISQPESPMVSITGFDESACGANDGVAATIVSGGTSSYTYSWYNGATTQNIISLSPGTYILSVTDANGCSGSNAVIINAAPGPTVSSITGINESSCGANDGAVVITVSGGATPYNYNWSNGATTKNITGLTAGTYTVIVTDSNGCTATDSIMLTQLSTLVLTLNTFDANCGSNDGSATVNVSGGTTPYTYSWSSGDTLASADSLTSGIYIITVTDASGCSVFAVATISDIGGASVSVGSITNVSCNGGSDGAININVSGGITPYTYEWSNGSTSEDINNVSAGPSEINITDGNGCITSASITVSEPSVLSLSISEQDANCGSIDGSATVSVNGGTGAYTYAWSSGGSDSTETGLAAGIYTVTISDANGCADSIAAAISNVGGPVISVDLIEEAGCEGDIGAIYITVTGSIPPYLYSWSNGSTGEDLVDIPAGEYDLTVTDSAGCLATASIEVPGIPPAFESICLVTVDSATGKNLIVWEKIQTQGVQSYNIYRESTQADVYYLVGSVPVDTLSQFIDTLSNPLQQAYRYKMSVVDSCDNESELSEPHKTMHLTINQGINNTVNLIWDHYEGFVFLTYYIERYTTSTGWVEYDSIQSNLTSRTDFFPPSGNLYYRIAAKHTDVCVASKKAENYNSSRSNTSTSISTSNAMTATATSTNATFGTCDGTATVLPQGGTLPYTYSWNTSPVQTNSTATGLCGNTTYSVTVYDANGDSAITQVTVNELTGITDVDFINSIKVFPNPSRGVFVLTIDDLRFTNGKLTMYDMLGCIILKSKIVNHTSEIDISDYPTGIYHLQVITNNGIGNKKIIIE